jgi:hypothetical protein
LRTAGGKNFIASWPPAQKKTKLVGQSVGLVLRPAILDRHVLALDVAGFTKALSECGQIACTIDRRRAAEESYYRHRALLRARVSRLLVTRFG